MVAPEMGALRRPGFVDIIDVSAVQGEIDWPKVAAAGFAGALVKVSEGANYCDPRALRNIAGARAAGMRFGVYMYLRVSDDDVDGQAQRAWDCLGDTMPSFRPVLDFENAPDGMPAAERIARAEAAADALARRFGRPPILYSYTAFLMGLGPALMTSKLGTLPLHLAQYRSTTTPWVPPVGYRPPVPKPWDDYVMHQYSGNGGFRVPGVPGDCDRNLFRGDATAFAQFCSGYDPDAPTQPELDNPASEPTLHVMPDMLAPAQERDDE